MFPRPLRLVPAVFLFFLLGHFLALSSARAGSLDVRSWLDRPGTRLVVVEFYATWCKPCMEAVPQWRQLHEKYRDQGLRLIVVSTLDPEGQCVNPGWNPDDMVCDPDGEIADAFKLDGRLPAAFLWSWQGNLLISRGHVAEVHKQVESYLKSNPRVLVQAKGQNKKQSRRLHDQIRAELSRTGKLTVVATAAERKALAQLRKASYKSKFDDRMQCQLGREVSANSLLKASLTGKWGKQRLALSLFSAESACLLVSATAPWSPKRTEAAVAEAVDRLLARLRHGVQMPGVRKKVIRQSPAPAPTPVPPRDDDGPLVLVKFVSQPEGAVVIVDGKLLCPGTPCSRSLVAGLHTVEMQKERFAQLKKQVQVRKGMKPLSLKLAPDFGWLSVSSEPRGVDIRIDGKVVGKTPLSAYELSAGPHDVKLEHFQYHTQSKQIRVVKGEKQLLRLPMKARLEKLVVIAKLPSGDEVAAQVSMDGQKLGTTPFSKEVIVGAHKLELVATKHGAWAGEVKVEPGKGARLEATLMGELLLNRSVAVCKARAQCVRLHPDAGWDGKIPVADFCEWNTVSQVTTLQNMKPKYRAGLLGLVDPAMLLALRQIEGKAVDIRLKELEKTDLDELTRKALRRAILRNRSKKLPELYLDHSPPSHFACPERPAKRIWLGPANDYFPDYILNHKQESPFVKNKIGFRIGTAILEGYSDSSIERFLDEKFNGENGLSDPDLLFNEVKTFIQLVANNASSLRGVVFELSDVELGLYDSDEINISHISNGFFAEINETLPSDKRAYVDVLKLTHLPDHNL